MNRERLDGVLTANAMDDDFRHLPCTIDLVPVDSVYISRFASKIFNGGTKWGARGPRCLSVYLVMME